MGRSRRGGGAIECRGVPTAAGAARLGTSTPTPSTQLATTVDSQPASSKAADPLEGDRLGVDGGRGDRRWPPRSGRGRRASRGEDGSCSAGDFGTSGVYGTPRRFRPHYPAETEPVAASPLVGAYACGNVAAVAGIDPLNRNDNNPATVAAGACACAATTHADLSGNAAARDPVLLLRRIGGGG